MLDGVVRVEVDGERLAEYGPGSLHGERAVLEGGLRTSTVRAVTQVQAGHGRGADQVDRAALERAERRAPPGGAGLNVPPGRVAGASTITVFLADDNLIVREGVRALLALETDFEVVGTAADYDELVAGAAALAPQVVVTDIRMPPTFHQEGIDAAHEIRKRHPGTGVVVLSQFDDPEYAISLLDEGSAGYAYLLKDRVAEGDQLARAVRPVATGGSVLDPAIVECMVHPVTDNGELSPAEEELLQPGGRGPADQGHRRRPGHDAGRRRRRRREAVPAHRPGGEQRRAELPAPSAHAARGHRQPGGAGRDLEPAAARRGRRHADGTRGAGSGETEEMVVSVLMSDIRGYSTIAEHADPSALARQLNVHRAEMNRAIVAVGGHGHAVRGRRRDGRVRGAGADGGPRRPGGGGRPWPCTPAQTEVNRPLAQPRGCPASGSASA